VNVIIDEAKLREIGVLLGLGYPKEKIMATTGLSEKVIATIAKPGKSPRKRMPDLRAVATAALAYRAELAQNPGAPVQAILAGIAESREEIDPGIAGLERHLLVTWIRGNRKAAIDAALRVGIEDAWTSIDMVAGRYVFPAGNPCTEHLRAEVGWGRASRYLDMTVDAMAQLINPAALQLLRGAMDWSLWRLRAEYMVRHEAVVEHFESWQWRAEIRGKHERVPWLIFSRALDACMGRFGILLLGIDQQNPMTVNAFASTFPISTVYTGDALLCHGQDKKETKPAAFIDALVPANNIAMLADHVIAIAAHAAPTAIIMPECRTLDIPFPDGYPVDDMTRLYPRDGRRASALPNQSILSLADQWKAQLKLNAR